MALIILFAFTVSAQVFSDLYIYEQGGSLGKVITDSIIWKIVKIDSDNLGSKNCNHKWKYSKEWKADYSFCDVLHYGEHCSYDDKIRNRICEKCLRHETQKEQWYQHREEKPLSEYDKLEKKLK